MNIHRRHFTVTVRDETQRLDSPCTRNGFLRFDTKYFSDHQQRTQYASSPFSHSAVAIETETQKVRRPVRTSRKKKKKKKKRNRRSRIRSLTEMFPNKSIRILRHRRCQRRNLRAQVHLPSAIRTMSIRHHRWLPERSKRLHRQFRPDFRSAPRRLRRIIIRTI